MPPDATDEARRLKIMKPPVKSTTRNDNPMVTSKEHKKLFLRRVTPDTLFSS
jgi:hypothetical protein